MSSTCYFCLLLLVSLFHLCLSAKNLNHVLCKDVERQALLRFKHGLIDRADRLASWVGEEKECCSWAGIVCDNFTGHVHQIHLRGVDGHCHFNFYDFHDFLDLLTKEELYDEASKEMLGGDLSPSLLDLKQLKHLDLSCNNFTGIKVPSFLGSLGNLRYLNISSSGFGGIIPPQLGNLSELQVLCLGSHGVALESTSMMNMQWLSNLRLLHHLDMSGVDLNKAFDWFQVINTLPSLVELHLSDCQLLHMHPHVPRLNLTSLSLLDLSRNYFLNSSMPRWIFSLTSLVSLDLSSCDFHGPIPGSVDSFRNLTSLEFLHVDGNDFMNSSSVLKGLSSVGSNLVSLDISLCGVTSSVLDALHNLTSLLSLDLSDNQLTKAIPKSLGNLCNLKEIDMSFNNFQNISLIFLLESFLECKSPYHLESLSLKWSNLSGPIPYSIGGLSSLKALDLSRNLFSGPIPYSIGGLSSLKTLDLSRNLVSGPIPYSIGGLSSLELLEISHNRLNGSLPDSLSQLSMLKMLVFSYNLLNGVVTKAHFAKLASLTWLDGSGNNLTFRLQPANWVPPFQLRLLYVSGWGLGPQFPLWLQLQRDLEELEISNTNISAPIPQSFWRSFPNLGYLNMSQNHIQGTLFSIPATLEAMDLSSNKFRGPLPHLSNRPSIQSLDLSDNLFAGSLHHFLCPSDVISIEFLNLGKNNLSSVIPECWEKWRSLSYINLENNNLHGEIPKTLGFLNQLKTLNMHGNKLTGRLPPLMNLTHLEILQLGGNELFGSIPAWFGRKLSVLRILNLRLNNFDENIPHELCYLSDIQILDLAHNNLSGNIPRCFNNFSFLTGEKAMTDDEFVFVGYNNDFIVSDVLVIKGREDTYNTILPLVMLLDLSNNNFSGHIPNELTALKMLRSLNLSRNQLTGRIPENIGDMKSLESFDVSLNKLCGELPMSLSRLSFLSSFNVSYNGFTGRVPTSTQLQSFNESSFFGNKLCGDPLTDHCVVEVLGRDHHEEDNDGAHGADWGLIISIVFGFVAGFWIIVGPLIISTSWRIAYFRSLTGLSYLVCDVMHKYRRNIFRM